MSGVFKAAASVDAKLRDQGIRNEVSIIASGASGRVRTSQKRSRSAPTPSTSAPLHWWRWGAGSAAAVTGGSAPPGGIATQREDLVRRLDPEAASTQVSSLIRAWTLELAEVMGTAGINSIESLQGNRDRLRGYMLDVKQVGA